MRAAEVPLDLLNERARHALMGNLGIHYTYASDERCLLYTSTRYQQHDIALYQRGTEKDKYHNQHGSDKCAKQYGEEAGQDVYKRQVCTSKPAKSTLVKPAVRGHVALKNACIHLSATDMPAKAAFHSKTCLLYTSLLQV